MTKKRLIIYVLITFVMTWLYCIAVIYPNVNGSDMATNAILQVLVAGTMFIPAIGVLITRLIGRAHV